MKISPPLNPGEFTFNKMKLGHSAFNCAWCSELGIDPKVIFDIGSYDAGDAIRFKTVFPEAEVFCFEADPEREEIIRKYISDVKDVYFHGAAIMDHTGMTKFYQSKCMLKDAGDTHSPGQVAGQGSVYKHTDWYKELYPHIEQDEESIKVPCFALGDFCDTWLNSIEIDVLHVDVEGAEINVIKGLGGVRPKLIYIETLKDMFEGCATIEYAHGLLDLMGYELVKDFVSDRLYIYKN